MSPLKLGIHGGAGRLGRRIIAQAIKDARFNIQAVVVREGSAALGCDVGVLSGGNPLGLETTSALSSFQQCAVVIDVSQPTAAARLAQVLAQNGGPPLLTGTTGWHEDETQSLLLAAKHIALLRSGNFSLGVTALVRHVRDIAAQLGPDRGVHIHDYHHSAKKDAPSGTALMLAEAVSKGWAKQVVPQCLPTGEPLAAPPKPAQIIITAKREGQMIGRHDVYFCNAEEILHFSHEALSRDVFAKGALQAAHWLAGKSAGLYEMEMVT
jgi:4-hydroxy-tetrahydrodipicolinate reductase